MMPPDRTSKRGMEDDEIRSYRQYCLVALIAGGLTWLLGLFTGTLLLLIVGGSVAVAAGCSLWGNWSTR